MFRFSAGAHLQKLFEIIAEMLSSTAARLLISRCLTSPIFTTYVNDRLFGGPSDGTIDLFGNAAKSAVHKFLHSSK